MRRKLLCIIVLCGCFTFTFARSVTEKAYEFYDSRDFVGGIEYFKGYCRRHPRNVEGLLALQMFYAYNMHSSFDVNIMRSCMLALDSTSTLANDFIIEYFEGCESIPREDIIREDGTILLESYSFSELEKAEIISIIARAYVKDRDFEKAYFYYKSIFPFYLKRQKELDALKYISLERGIGWALARLRAMRDSIRDYRYDLDYQDCLNQALIIGHDDNIDTFEDLITAHSFVMGHKDSVSHYLVTPEYVINEALKKVAYYEKEVRSYPNYNMNKDSHIEAIADLAGVYGYYGMFEQTDSCLNLIDSISQTYFPIVGDRFLCLSWLYSAKDKLCMLRNQSCCNGFRLDTIMNKVFGIDDSNIVDFVKNGKYAFCDYMNCYEGFAPHMYDHYMDRAWILANSNKKNESLRSIEIADSISLVYLSLEENCYLYEQYRYANKKNLIRAYLGDATDDTSLLETACSSIVSNLQKLYWEKLVSPHKVSPFDNFFGTEVYSEYDRQEFHKIVEMEKDAIWTYAYRNPGTQMCTTAYDMSLFLKSLLVNTQRMLFADALEQDSAMMLQLLSWKEELLKLPLNYQYDSIQALINQTEARWIGENFERLDIALSSLFSNVQNVHESLRDNEVAIEFVDFREIDGLRYTGKHPYYALLLLPSRKHPELIPLFDEEELAPLINTRIDSATNNTYDYNHRGQIIFNKVWENILPYINSGNVVYFAPSGVLHQLAIEALPYNEDSTMAEKYNLIRLSSTREITQSERAERHITASVYGGIEYEVSTTELEAKSKKYASNYIPISRGFDGDYINRGTVDFLEGAKIEVESISALLRHNNLKVHLYTATDANEESFKALSGARNSIIHVATHGFFWSDSTAQKKDYFIQRGNVGFGSVGVSSGIDPLNRCGLLFAGANTALSGRSIDIPQGVQDGILTAKEISLLDLRDADLVVLSACETGKGEITGEGVCGLQRAFKQAGAQTIIMSLWSVNDVATQLLMTEFYRNWITLHQSKREAFRNAQNTVRSQYPEPAYWAGFIMLD